MADLELIVEPRVVKTRAEFSATAPAFSIALDGYVYGATFFDPTGPRLNLNHHEEVDRLSTLSTAGQVFNYLKAGLFEYFQQGHRPMAKVHVNDPDQDTSLSCWELWNHERITGYHSEPLISRLVFAQDKLDIFAGAYPFAPASEIMKDVFWIFQPYAEQRGKIATMDASGMRAIMEAVGARIDHYVIGKGEKLAVVVQDHFKMLRQGTGWSLVEETGPYARTGLYHAGIQAFVAYRGENKGSHQYSFGRFSPFVPFSLLKLYERLNQEEGITTNNSDRWGGGNTAGGSPRERGSVFAPDVLFEKVEKIMKG